MSCSAVFACTQARSEILASLPAIVYRQVSPTARRRDGDNGLWRLLHDQPNPEMDAMVLYELLQTRVVNRGNGFCEIERDRSDVPVALWPIHNSRVQPFRDGDRQLMWRVFTDSIDARTDRFRSYTIPDRNMLNVVGFGGDGILAPGVIPTAVEEISLNMAMTRYGAKYFSGGGRPMGVVEHPGFYDDDNKRKVYREDINTLHMVGEANWHKVATLWDGAKFKELQFSPEQSQFIVSRQFSNKQICQFYKTPPAIVQIFEDYKFATVDAMIQQFVMTCVLADARRVEGAIRRKVTHTQDSRGRLVEVFKHPFIFEFLIEALLRGDSKKQAEVLEIERRNAIINADEWRALSNREPLEGEGEPGKKYIVPGGFEDISKLGENRSGGGSAGSGGNQQSAKFDREWIAARLESGVPKHHDRGGGGSAEEATTLRDESSKNAVLVMNLDAERIDALASKETSKLAAQGGLSDSQRNEKLEAISQKRIERLRSAMRSGAELYCKYRELDVDALCDLVAANLLPSTKVTLDLLADCESKLLTSP